MSVSFAVQYGILKKLYRKFEKTERSSFRQQGCTFDIYFNYLYLVLGPGYRLSYELDRAQQALGFPVRNLKGRKLSKSKAAASTLSEKCGYSIDALERSAMRQAELVLDSMSMRMPGFRRPVVLKDPDVDTLAIVGPCAHVRGYVYVQMSAHPTGGQWTRLHRVFIALLDGNYVPIPSVTLAVMEASDAMALSLNKIFSLANSYARVSVDKTLQGLSGIGSRTPQGSVAGKRPLPAGQRAASPSTLSGAVNVHGAKKVERSSGGGTYARPHFENTNATGAVTKKRTIKVRDFVVRSRFGTHRNNGHSLESIQGEVAILPYYGGEPELRTFRAYWCPKCKKYFILDDEYKRLKTAGLICCRIIEEKELKSFGTKGKGEFGSLAAESVAHTYGYTVSKQSGLSRERRQLILSFLIENRIQTTQELASLLELLIDMRKKNPSMRDAVSCWREDLRFLRNYQRPKRTVRVDKLYVRGNR